MERYKLKIVFDKIEGTCRVHEEGDEFLVEDDGQALRMSNTEKICLHALGSISALLPALSRKLNEEDKLADKDYVRCPDPGPECGGSGKAYMKIIREKL